MPFMRVLPAPHPAATSVTIVSGRGRGVGVMPYAEDAIDSPSRANAVDLNIFLLHGRSG
jgi:hypothetical protein